MVQPNQRLWFHRTWRGDKDVFVHISAVQAAGMTTLEPDQKIEYELEDGKDGKVSAGNLKAI